MFKGVNFFANQIGPWRCLVQIFQISLLKFLYIEENRLSMLRYEWKHNNQIEYDFNKVFCFNALLCTILKSHKKSMFTYIKSGIKVSSKLFELPKKCTSHPY